jgi:putative tryptophan/tyrosine transport system substrate-binding protein
MKRRDLITLLGGSALAWPLAARAQQPGDRVRRIGVLMAHPEGDPEFQAYVAAIQGGTSEAWVDRGPQYQDRHSLGGTR